MIWSENQVIGFYIKRNTRLKWVKTDFLGPKKLFVYLRTDKPPPSITPKSVFQESSKNLPENFPEIFETKFQTRKKIAYCPDLLTVKTFSQKSMNNESFGA